ncbi:RNA binding protein, partial [Phytophthora palmivora]
HMKFAHLYVHALKQIVLKEMADGIQSLKLEDFKEPLDCIACTMGKQRRMSYKRHNKCSTRYFQLVQDEASWHKWCYLLEHKRETTMNLTNLILRLEKQHIINRVTFDRGGAFVNNKMKTFLTENGIEF